MVRTWMMDKKIYDKYQVNQRLCIEGNYKNKE